MKRTEIYEAIDSERDYQDEKWKEYNDADNSASDWILYIETHLNKAKMALYNSHDMATYRNEMRKVAGLAVACGEQVGFNKR
jgi:hypothetical protein